MTGQGLETDTHSMENNRLSQTVAEGWPSSDKQVLKMY